MHIAGKSIASFVDYGAVFVESNQLPEPELVQASKPASESDSIKGLSPSTEPGSGPKKSRPIIEARLDKTGVRVST